MQWFIASSWKVEVENQSQALYVFVCYGQTGERDRKPEEELGSGENDSGRLRHSAGCQPSVRPSG